MSQFMEVMMGQQSLLMTLANVVPRAPELPTGPVAGQPVVPPPVPHGQPQEVWDVDAVSRDASDAEPLFEEGTEPEVTSQHSEQDDPEVLDTNDPMWSVVERAARHLGVDWPASEPTRRSLFELPSAHTLQSRILPAFPDFIKEVQSTWGAPASTPATSRKAAAFNMHGASEAGLASFPPVGAAFAALVKAPTLSGLAKDPSCPNRQCRITEAHLKKGYAAATEAVRLSNVASLLTVYQAALLRDLPECPSAALRTELGTVAQLLVKLAQLNARAQGRSIASLVVARRQLWLSQARVQEPDKVPLLDAPISPGHTFGPAVEEMLQRSVKAREASQQLAKMWPSKPFQPRRPQERQWRRAPPQQQAQSRGSMTAPSGVSARGQPAFVRPQRGGWRPRGGGKPRPRGSGQAPRNRGCIRNLSLLLMAIESELLKIMDFDDIITELTKTGNRGGRCWSKRSTREVGEKELQEAAEAATTTKAAALILHAGSGKGAAGTPSIGSHPSTPTATRFPTVPGNMGLAGAPRGELRQ
ncbi:UNVERIFIED_CONTAM: hypothetical protein FKN15_013044 [Acipenser sinensis]